MDKKDKLLLFLQIFLVLFLAGCAQPQQKSIDSINLTEGLGRLVITLDKSAFNLPSEIIIDPHVLNIYKYKLMFKIENNGIFPDRIVQDKKIYGKICLTSPTMPDWTIVNDEGEISEDSSLLCKDFDFTRGISSGSIPFDIIFIPSNDSYWLRPPLNVKTSREYDIVTTTCYYYANVGYVKTCLYSSPSDFEKYSSHCPFEYKFSKGPIQIDEVRLLSTPIKTDSGIIINFLIKLHEKYTDSLKESFEYYAVDYNSNSDTEEAIRDSIDSACSPSSALARDRVTIRFIVDGEDQECTGDLIDGEGSITCSINITENVLGNKPFIIQTIPIYVEYIVKDRTWHGSVKVIPPASE